MEMNIDFNKIELARQAKEQLIKIDNVAMLIHLEVFDTVLEIKSIRDIQLKQVYLELIKEYLDLMDCVDGPCFPNYRNIYLVFNCFDLRGEVDIRYINFKNKQKRADLKEVVNNQSCQKDIETFLDNVSENDTLGEPMIKMGHDCDGSNEWLQKKIEDRQKEPSVVSDFRRQFEYEQTIPDKLSSGCDFATGVDVGVFATVHPEYVTKPDKVILVGDEQRAFAFKDNKCCGEITTEEQLKKVKSTQCGKEPKRKTIQVQARRHGPSLFDNPGTTNE